MHDIVLKRVYICSIIYFITFLINCIVLYLSSIDMVKYEIRMNDFIVSEPIYRSMSKRSTNIAAFSAIIPPESNDIQSHKHYSSNPELNVDKNDYDDQSHTGKDTMDGTRDSYIRHVRLSKPSGNDIDNSELTRSSFNKDTISSLAPQVGDGDEYKDTMKTTNLVSKSTTDTPPSAANNIANGRRVFNYKAKPTKKQTYERRIPLIHHPLAHAASSSAAATQRNQIRFSSASKDDQFQQQLLQQIQETHNQQQPKFKSKSQMYFYQFYKPPQSQSRLQQQRKTQPPTITAKQLYNHDYITTSNIWRNKTIALYTDEKPVVSIRGAMSSGTNWLRSLFSANCPDVPFLRNLTSLGSLAIVTNGKKNFTLEFDADALYGWKHGLLGNAEIEMLRKNPHHSIIILVRNAVDWLTSMHRMAKTGMLPKRIYSPDINIFQTLQYPHKCPNDFPGTTLYRYYVAISNQTGIPQNVTYLDANFTGCSEYSQEAPNLVKGRDRDYKNWIKAMKLRPNQIKLIRYEDLKENPYKVFNSLVRSLPGERGTDNFINYCNFTESTFNKVSSYTKYGKVGSEAGKKLRNINAKANVSFEDIKRLDEIDLCQKLFKEANGTIAYNNLLSTLDIEFERETFGYNYPTRFSDIPCNSRPPSKHY